jgi:uncharacterized protein (DUF2225 family)
MSAMKCNNCFTHERMQMTSNSLRCRDVSVRNAACKFRGLHCAFVLCHVARMPLCVYACMRAALSQLAKQMKSRDALSSLCLG